MPVYDRQRIGDLISRTSVDGAALRLVVAEALADAVTGAVGLVGVVAMMIWLDWALFLIVVGLITAGLLIALGALRGIRTAALAAQQSTGEMTAELERALGAIRTARASRAERREAERIGAHARSICAAGVRMARFEAVVGPASELAVSGSFLVVLLVGGMRVANGSASVGELVAFLLYMIYLTGPVGSLFHAASAIQQAAGALQRIDDVLRLPNERDVPSAATTTTRPGGKPPDAGTPSTRRPMLEFRQVCFSYQPGRRVLHKVSFQVPDRGHVALVGRSGAGKSTIFALAERFYEPDHGEILFQGDDLRSLDRRVYRAQIGLVEQQAPVLHGSLRDNLVYAAPHATDDEIERVIELANLSTLVTRLPNGLDSDVGERGGMLSGGERQRLAIARSLLARPGLLFLDEPTAHLDVFSEAAFRRTMQQVAAESALVVATHRLPTIQDAQQIVVLDQGRVTAVGRHEELLDTNSYYERLVAGWAANQSPRPTPAPVAVRSRAEPVTPLP